VDLKEFLTAINGQLTEEMDTNFAEADRILATKGCTGPAIEQ
jgi:hypothetical protein